MKLKAAITEGMPSKIRERFGSPEFAKQYLREVAEKCLGAEGALAQPAGFYLQKPDETVNVGALGVELRLSGVSRSNREPKQFHRALDILEALATRIIVEELRAVGATDRVQLFCVVMVDAQVPTTPSGGQYSTILESSGDLWLTKDTPIGAQ